MMDAAAPASSLPERPVSAQPILAAPVLMPRPLSLAAAAGVAAGAGVPISVGAPASAGPGATLASAIKPPPLLFDVCSTRAICPEVVRGDGEASSAATAAGLASGMASVQEPEVREMSLQHDGEVQAIMATQWKKHKPANDAPPASHA